MIEQLNQREFVRIQQIYPLFKMERKGKYLTVHTGRNSSFCPWLVDGHLEHQDTLYLDHAYMERSMSNDLMKIYPDLFIHVYASKNGCQASVWINRLREGEPDDAESIGELDILTPGLHTVLTKWQKEAAKAKQENWFFCSGHSKAEPMSKYGYFHFAGKYCKAFGDENPNSRKAAANENYN